MKALLLATVVCFCNCFASRAQEQKPSEIFYCHYYICHVIAYSYTDYTIELYKDSTLRIRSYSSNREDDNNSLIKQTYSGTYSMNGDTVCVKILAYRQDKRYKKKPNPLKLAHAVPGFAISSSFHLLKKKNSLLPIGEIWLPEMKTSSVEQRELLEDGFAMLYDIRHFQRKKLGLDKPEMLFTSFKPPEEL